MIKEDFLHFVWQHQYFNSKALRTTAGEPVAVIKPGVVNQLAGPDFKEALVDVNGIQWAGSVEIHIKSSDWKAHKHQGDPNYSNVVLHLVYFNDYQVCDNEGKPIPTLELKGLIKPGLLNRYQQIIKSNNPIACAELFPKVRSVTKLAMLEAALIQRLQRKGALFKELLVRNKQDWEQSVYEWLAQGFGFKTNAQSMLALAQTVPLRVLRKHSDLKQWEALLFGASGLLNTRHTSSYAYELKREYTFLERKYAINSQLSFNQWHFSGVRPTNFPTVRIAQWAALVHKNHSLFSLFTDFSNTRELQKRLQVQQSTYWQQHFNFGVENKQGNDRLSKSAISNLMINTVAPLLVAYSEYKDETDMLEQAMNVLMSLPVENNHIIRSWYELGWNVNSGFDTQGLIELYNEYCKHNNCLKCKIGVELIRS
ncbi:DUF2851 family protein [Roseivirga thermotolerans]|uniref:DUF2851 family protein n=1 Tax=Roseivirga thermotolerans TaxID=1758176 RepID=UPI00273CFFC9|nr:DUF2851 family protein [Roseivirga thermotolerans]